MRNPNNKSSSKKLHLTQETVKALTVRTGCKTGFLVNASGACGLIKTVPGNQGKGQCTEG